MFDVILYISALILTFVITVVISHKLIPVLKSKKMGQKILEIGPRWHKSKEGTPTMGGDRVYPCLHCCCCVGKWQRGASFCVCASVRRAQRPYRRGG